MKKAFGLLCAIVLLAAGQTFAAKVTNVELTWQDGFTVARLDVQGTVRYSHQSEVAKDGKPFRVIVDILSATHQLGQKNFFELPPCPVTKIRTSQFAVTPEQVVRVVFDMTGDCVYQIKSDEKSVIVSFPDPNGKSFAAWSSTRWIAAQQQSAQPPAVAQAPAPTTKTPAAPSTTTSKSTAEANQTINNDRLASLESAPSATAKPATTTTPAQTTPKPQSQPVKPTAPATPPSTANTPSKTTPSSTTPSTVAPESSDATRKPALPNVAKPDTLTSEVPRKPDIKPEPPQPMMTTDANTTSKPSPSTAKPAPAVTAPQTTTNKLAPATSTKPTAPTATSTPAPKPSTASTPAKSTSKPEITTGLKPAPATGQKPAEPVEGVKPLDDAEPEDLEPAVEQQSDQKQRGTARFRRSPTSPAKIKGTLVAEFPTRLVIKYEAGGNRDPFATLIDETKKYNSPVERRIPNVEGIRLVGVIESETGNSALFEDKDGYGYILREGDKIQKGYCLRIQPERVFFQIFEYGWSRTVALNLESEY